MKPAILLLVSLSATGVLFGALAFSVALGLLTVWMAIGAREIERVTPRTIDGEPLRQTLLAIDRQTQARRGTVARWQQGRKAS